MATKRKRATRNMSASVVSKRAIENYKLARSLEAKYIGCLQDECDQPDGAPHCDDCASYLEACRAVKAELRIPPYAASPLDADGPCPYPGNAGIAHTWPAAVQLREQLEELSK